VHQSHEAAGAGAFLGGMAGFVVFSWAAAFAPSFGWLIAFRVAQGICNATTLPSVMGILSQVFPEHQRGGALGFWAAVNGASHGLGPILSGVLINLFNWRATFIFIGLLTFVGLLLLACLVPSDRKKGSRPFDWLGTGTFTLAILSLMLNLSHIGKAGWPAWISYSLWGAFLVMAAGFVIAVCGARLPCSTARPPSWLQGSDIVFIIVRSGVPTAARLSAMVLPVTVRASPCRMGSSSFMTAGTPPAW